jgi:hypothetical protein
MRYLVFILLLSGCADTAKQEAKYFTTEIKTGYPDIKCFRFSTFQGMACVVYSEKK